MACLLAATDQSSKLGAASRALPPPQGVLRGRQSLAQNTKQNGRDWGLLSDTKMNAFGSGACLQLVMQCWAGPEGEEAASFFPCPEHCYVLWGAGPSSSFASCVAPGLNPLWSLPYPPMPSSLPFFFPSQQVACLSSDHSLLTLTVGESGVTPFPLSLKPYN